VTLLLLLAGMAMAGPPEGLRPVLAPWDAPEKWAAYRASSGEEADPLACDVVVDEEVRLCLRLLQAGRLRWVTASDLAAWDLTMEQAVAAVRAAAAPRLGELETVAIEGMQASYVRLVDGEGWAAALALHPEQVADALGPDARIAFPAGTVAVAWAAAAPEVDKAMAVGVVELADEQPGAVSHTVFRWSGEELVPYAEARVPSASGTEDPPPEASSPTEPEPAEAGPAEAGPAEAGSAEAGPAEAGSADAEEPR